MTSGLIQKETEKKNNELQDVIQCSATKQISGIKSRTHTDHFGQSEMRSL